MQSTAENKISITNINGMISVVILSREKFAAPGHVRAFREGRPEAIPLTTSA